MGVDGEDPLARLAQALQGKLHVGIAGIAQAELHAAGAAVGALALKALPGKEFFGTCIVGESRKRDKGGDTLWRGGALPGEIDIGRNGLPQQPCAQFREFHGCLIQRCGQRVLCHVLATCSKLRWHRSFNEKSVLPPFPVGSTTAGYASTGRSEVATWANQARPGRAARRGGAGAGGAGPVDAARAGCQRKTHDSTRNHRGRRRSACAGV